MKYSSSPVSGSQQHETVGFSNLGLGQGQIPDKTQGKGLGQVQQQTGRQDLDQDGSQLSQRYEKQKGMTTHLMNQEHGRSQVYSTPDKQS